MIFAAADAETWPLDSASFSRASASEEVIIAQ